MSLLFRLPRTLLLVPLTLVGCHDFVGDLGRIGFASDLRVGGQAWTPESSVAAGTVARFLPVDLIVDEDRSETVDLGEDVVFDAEVSGRRLSSWTEELEDGLEVLAVTGTRGGGRVSVSVHGSEGVAVEDRFDLVFVAASTAQLLEPLATDGESQPSEWLPIDEILELELGDEVRLDLDVRDRRGRSLGWRADEVEVLAEGGVSAWLDDHTVVIVGDEDGSVEILLHGETLAEQEVEVYTTRR